MTGRSVMRFSGLSLKRRHYNDQLCEVTVAHLETMSKTQTTKPLCPREPMGRVEEQFP